MKPKNQTGRTFALLRTLGSTAVRAGKESLRKKLSQGAEDLQLDERMSVAAVRLADGLDQLKGAAMKVGQMLSLGDEDLLPKGWKMALSRLQASATPREWHEIEPIIVKSLGSLDAFAAIDPVAVHAASIAQVHKATLKDGRMVAVKVRYPGLEETLRSDLDSMRKLFKLTNILPTKGDFEQILQTVEEVFLQELDFEKEKEFCKFYRKAFAGFPDFYVPEVVESCCGEGVLTLEWVEGLGVERWIAAHPRDDSDPESIRRYDALGERILRLMFAETFLLGHIQSDPNPGNFLVTADGRLSLLDFGATQELSGIFLANYRDLIVAMDAGATQTVLDTARRMGFLTPDDEEEVEQSFLKMMDIVWRPFATETYSWRDQRLAKEMREEGLRFAKAVRFRAPPAETFFFNRRLLGTELLLERLGATVPARKTVFGVLELSRRMAEELLGA